MTELFRSKDEEIAWLRKRTRELEERIETLEYNIASRDEVEEFETVAIMRALNLPLGQARILRLLSNGQPYTRERLMEEYSSDFDFELRNVDSQIKRIRSRVHSVPIRAVYGYGYQMSPEGVARVKEIITDAKRQRKEELDARMGTQH